MLQPVGRDCAPHNLKLVGRDAVIVHLCGYLQADRAECRGRWGSRQGGDGHLVYSILTSAERQRDKETARQRDKETERDRQGDRNRETERQRQTFSSGCTMQTKSLQVCIAFCPDGSDCRGRCERLFSTLTLF